MSTQLTWKTFDTINENIALLKQLFPEAFSEDKIIFEKLEQLLGKDAMADKERYDFTRWGKKDAIKLALAQTTGTLRPDKASSKNWDTTQNLYIEGDNLEVLRTLQESYRNKVKMIYIDPPYNTGKDFVYKDNFVDNVSSYKEKMSENMKSNPETNGRYHTDWLNMMYPRLKLARNLLKDDGVIFISIDDNEVANLRKICDEIFGEENFIAECVWQHSLQPKAYENRVSWHHNYTLIYKKSDAFILWLFERTEEDNVNYSNPDNDPKWKWRSWDVRSSYAYRGNLMYAIKAPNWNVISSPDKGRRWSEEQMKEKINTWEVIFNKDQTGIIRKIYLEEQGWRNPESIWFWKKYWTTRNGNKVIQDLFWSLVFDTPKPYELIKNIAIIWNTKDHDIVMDFFSWAATTAHAIMDLNAEDGWNRKYIMVQIPEATDASSEAYKTWYKNICEIGKERIRRAGDKIKEERGLLAWNIDVWFKCFTLDSTNLKKRDTNPEDVTASLLDMVTPLKSDRAQEDMLYEIMLKNGMDLTLPITTETIQGKQIFTVAGNYLIVCLEKDISLDVIKEIAHRQPKVVVLYDESFKDDMTKLNALEQLSKTTADGEGIQVRVI